MTAVDLPPARVSVFESFSDRCSMVTNGTTRQACAADPTAGLLPALGRGAVAAVVGVNREPDIGLGGGSSVTGAAASTVALARQAALAGLPTIAVCLPASSASDTDEDEDDGALAAAAEALEVGGGGTLRNDIIGLTTGASVQAVLAALVEAGLLNPERQAENWPRAHFPFPGLSRWSALGSAQLPVDAALAAGLAEPSSLAEGFASAGASLTSPRDVDSFIQ